MMEQIVRAVVATFLMGLILCPALKGDEGRDQTADKAGSKLNVACQICEINRAQLSDLGIDPKLPDMEMTLSATGETQQKLVELQKSKKLKIITEPSVVGFANQKFGYFSGGEVTIPLPDTDDGPTEEKREFGTRVEVTPTWEADGRVKLQWFISHSVLDESLAVRQNGKLVPGIKRWRLQGSTTTALGEPAYRIVSMDRGKVWLVRIRTDGYGGPGTSQDPGSPANERPAK